MLTTTAASPEILLTSQHLKSWAVKVFPEFKGDHRDFDRAALGLLCMWTLWKEKSLASLGGGENASWRDALVKTLSVPGGFEALTYAILFNNLGKLEATGRAIKKAGRNVPADHDESLALALRVAPKEVAPGFSKLQGSWGNMWITGLDSGFNAGMAMRMELPRAGWKKWLSLAEDQRAFHALHSYFDLLGSSGAEDPMKPTAAQSSRAMGEIFAQVCFGPSPEQFEKEIMLRFGWESSGRPALAVSRMCGANAVNAPGRIKASLDALGAEHRDAFDWALGEKACVAWPHASAVLSAGGQHGLGALIGEEGARALSAIGQAFAQLRVLIPDGAEKAIGRAVGIANLREMSILRKDNDEKWSQKGRWVDSVGGWTWAPV